MVDVLSEGDWESLSRNLLRAELMRRGMSYAGLVEALAKIGVQETEAAIKNKVSRGRFPLMFFLQTMVAIEAGNIRIPSETQLLEGFGLGNGGAQVLARNSASRSPAE